MNKHIDEPHTEMLTVKECDCTSTSVNCMTVHHKLKHSTKQFDGSTEMLMSDKKEHDDLWCYQCEEENPNGQGCEYQSSYKPAIKAHKHNKQSITIFKDITIMIIGTLGASCRVRFAAGER